MEDAMSEPNGDPRPLNPLQPIVTDPHGTVRFQENEIVRMLLDKASAGQKVDLNDIALWDVPQDDRVQFAQLIGYSVSSFQGLSYVDEESALAADHVAAAGESETEARLKAQRVMLQEVKQGVRQAAVTLFDVHPDDLT